VTSVLRTIDKVGGLDVYLTGFTRGRMKELGPRGWEIRAAVIKSLRQQERKKYVQMFQRSILLCPHLRMDSTWKVIRPWIRHTEGYAVLPEEFCKKAFRDIMERLREGRPVMRRRTIHGRIGPRTIILRNGEASKFVRRVRLYNMAPKLRREAVQQRQARLKKQAKPKPKPKESISLANVANPEITVDQKRLNNMRHEGEKQRKEEERKQKYKQHMQNVRAQALEAAIRQKQLRKMWLS
jgi:hypothetical protein